jgi:hypothetical protein
MRRHEIKDEDWERIKDMLPGQPGDPGVTAKDNRLFINAVLWIAKTGAPWRDLPESALIVVGSDHRLADPEPLEAMPTACRSRS